MCVFSSVRANTVDEAICCDGEVTSLEVGKIVLMTKDGSLDVTLSDKTVYKRVPARKSRSEAAVASSLSDHRRSETNF
jgi:hypothetical protein